MKWMIAHKYVLTVNAISVMVAFLTHFPELIALFDFEAERALFPGMRGRDVAVEMTFTYLSLLLLFFLNERLFRFGDSRVGFGWSKVLASFLLTWLMSNLLGKAFVYMHDMLGLPAIDATLHKYLHPLRDFLMSSIVTGSCSLIHLARKSRRVLLENEQLRTENMVHQYEALKSQLNPHMLFNSLNTLDSLIGEDTAKAHDYLQKLSRVLRYTLRVNENPLVTLQEEMECALAYIYLLQMRYEDNLHFEIQTGADTLQRRLPPMSVQMLVENAVKHNEISRRRPLSIRIVASGDHVTVDNPIQSKRTSGETTCIGLSNLSNRYRLLYGHDIEIKENNGHFIVKLPLL